jgi:hypothetical protein
MGPPRAIGERSRLAGMARRRRQLKDPEPLSDVLSRSSPDRSARSACPIPVEAWRRAVGPRIVERARPLRIDGRVLTVQAATAVWVQELTFLAPTIVERLRASGFDVGKIRFRVGPIEPALRTLEPAARRIVPAPHPLPSAVSREIAKIGDPALRQAIAKAAATNLAWQRASAAEATEERPGARAPRSSAPETAPPDRGPRPSRGAGPHRP